MPFYKRARGANNNKSFQCLFNLRIVGANDCSEGVMTPYRSPSTTNSWAAIEQWAMPLLLQNRGDTLKIFIAFNIVHRRSISRAVVKSWIVAPNNHPPSPQKNSQWHFNDLNSWPLTLIQFIKFWAVSLYLKTN